LTGGKNAFLRGKKRDSFPWGKGSGCSYFQIQRERKKRRTLPPLKEGLPRIAPTMRGKREITTFGGRQKEKKERSSFGKKSSPHTKSPEEYGRRGRIHETPEKRGVPQEPEDRPPWRHGETGLKPAFDQRSQRRNPTK